MVLVKANDPLLCRLLDALVKPAEGGSPAPNASTSSTPASSAACSSSLLAEVVQPFIAATLHNTVEALPPSQLQDALWLFLFLRREFLADEAHECAGGGDSSNSEATKCMTGQDAVAAVLNSQRLAFSTTVVAMFGAQEHASSLCGQRQLDDLLRRKQDDLHAAKPPASSPEAAASAAEDKSTSAAAPGSALAVLELALAAFTHARKLHALLTPATLALLVRDLESLWVLLFLCKQVKLRLLRQANILVGRDVRRPLRHPRRHPRDAEMATDEADDEEALPADAFFHDYALLLPLHLLDSFAEATRHSVKDLLTLCQPAAARAVWERQSRLFRTAAAARRTGEEEAVGNTVAERARAMSTAAAAGARPLRVPVLRPNQTPEGEQQQQQQHQQQEERQCGREAEKGDVLRHPTPSIALVINAAVSSAAPNPSRQLKNRRVDVIEQAAMRYYYQRLTQLGNAKKGAAGAAHGDASDMYTHLQAQLSTSGSATVIDPTQMGRHWLPEDEDGLDTHAPAGETAAGAAWLPAHRRMKSLQRIASEKASFAQFMKDSFIGLDIQIMAMSGAAIGYYMGFLRGASKETCLVYAAVGLVVMMLVDAVLLMIRLGREDETMRKEKKRIARQRAKLFATHAVKSDAAARQLERELGSCSSGDPAPEPETTKDTAMRAAEKKNQ